MLTDKGGFHPTLLASFIKAVGIYPPGNIVAMSNGTRGIAVAAGQRIDRPKVQITHDAKGQEISKEQQYMLDLGLEKHSSLHIEEILLSSSYLFS